MGLCEQIHDTTKPNGFVFCLCLRLYHAWHRTDDENDAIAFAEQAAIEEGRYKLAFALF